jgi:RNA polymerase sigma factor (sigma-70 family)
LPADSSWIADTATTELALRTAVAALPERQRTALVLRFFADLPPKEVASVMGCQEGTVWALVHQAIDALRRAPGFERMEVTDD